jgi:Protein of unknown function (DUF2934)
MSAENRRIEGFMAREVAITRNPGTEAAAPNQAEPTQATPAAKRNFLRPLYLVPHRLTPAERHRRICDLAYRRAEMRGFAPGHEQEDWLEAEREVDAERY